MKKTIVLVDHSFHQKTKSSDFFKNILQKEYKVEWLWDDSWTGKPPVSFKQINFLNPDIVIYWQIRPLPHIIKKINAKNIIWVPMEEYERSILDWQIYKKTNLKILCFQKANFDIVSRLGFKTFYIQYFIKPHKINKDYSKNKIIFWQRTGDITWNLVKKIIGNQNIDNIFFKDIPDPFMFGLPKPKENDIKKYNIILSDKWLSDDELENLYKNYNIFIAPRKYEGIGMVLLEAMSYGLVAIAPDTPTHNEYIKNGVNGFLYDINNPVEIELKNLESIGKNALLSIENGYENWIESENLLFKFIEEQNEVYKIEPKSFSYKISFYYFLFRVKLFLKSFIKKVIYKFFKN